MDAGVVFSDSMPPVFEQPLFQAFSQRVNLDDAFRYARLLGNFDFFYLAARDAFIQREAQSRGLLASDEQVQAAADEFRRQRGLLTQSATTEWLSARGVSLQEFEAAMEAMALENLLRAAVVGGEVEAYFSKHQAELEEADVSAIATDDQSLATQIYLSALDGDESFAALACRFSSDAASRSRGGFLGTVPLSALPEDAKGLLRIARVGEVLPPILGADGKYYVYRCEAYRPPRLDEPTRLKIERQLFESWLKSQEGRVGPLRENA
jgi:parvulin-like peptidyl-prolyl isomerase